MRTIDVQVHLGSNNHINNIDDDDDDDDDGCVNKPPKMCIRDSSLSLSLS